MSAEKARELIVEAIGEDWLAEVVEMDLGWKRRAYIAQLNKSVCLGTPTVVVESGKGMRYASVAEARKICARAREGGLLSPGLYL